MDRIVLNFMTKCKINFKTFFGYLFILSKLNLAIKKYKVINKLCKFTIIFGFVYQLIDLTQQYLNYNHLVDVNIDHTYDEWPSFTSCFKPSQFSKDLLSVS